MIGSKKKEINEIRGYNFIDRGKKAVEVLLAQKAPDINLVGKKFNTQQRVKSR